MELNKEPPIATHQDCPSCGHQGCLTVWANGSMKCHSCGDPSLHKPNSTGGTIMHKEAPPHMEDTTVYTEKKESYRSIPKSAVDKYGITTSYNDKGEAVRRVYPYPHKSKYRHLPKDFSKNRGFTTDHLFGMDKFNAGSSKYITIVEGEDDVPSAYTMLGERSPVVGLPGAGISSALLKNCKEYLDSFEQIIVATDNDEAGINAANKLASVFPNKVYKVPFTKHNDPNEYLVAGDESDFKFAWINRTKFVPEFDISTPDAYLKLLREGDDDEYIPTGIQEYDDKHLGLFQGHFTLFTAPEGTGKTELFHYFEHHLIKNYPDVPFASCHLEETQRRTTLAWASYDLDKNVTRKDLIKDMDEVEKSVEKMTKGEQVHLFKIGTDEDPMVLIERINYYVEVCGCKYVFIEPIQDLAQQYHGPESTERFLSKIAVNLARLASEKNVGIVAIAHENDEGLVSDCRKLSKQASVLVRLERDIENADEDVRNTTTLRSKKNRPSSFVGYGGQIKFNSDTFTLKEIIT